MFFIVITWFVFLILAGFVLEAVAMNIYEIKESFVPHAKTINVRRVKFDSDLDINDLASNEQIHGRVYWILYYAKNREVYKRAKFPVENNGYRKKRLGKDGLSVAWFEGLFVNYSSQDDGTGFGWIAMQWDHVDTLISIYDWPSSEKRIIADSGASDQLQAKYLVGNLLYWYNYYGSRGKAIEGYNKGYGVSEYWEYSYYWLAVSGRINQLDKWLREANNE